MKKRIVAAAALLALAVAGATAGDAQPAHPAPRTVSVIVALKDRARLAGLSKTRRSVRLEQVVTNLKAKAQATQGPIRALLAKRRAQGRVTSVEPFWIFNGLAVTATEDVIAELEARSDVASVRPNATLQAPAPVVATAAEANIERVNAPALWQLGFRGQGVVVASLDTGVDVTHPDLAAQWRGGTNSWFDPNGEHPDTPFDANGHGTGTMGVIVGADKSGTAVGIAPDASWIAVKIFNDRGVATAAGIHAGFQWLLDPDGDPSTADAPRVVNDSWAFETPGCNLEFEPDIQALRAAGILSVFAAGNGGPSDSTSMSPGNNPSAVAVGATDGTDAVFTLSSRGPSSCGGVEDVYPELVAPGVDIRTTDLYGGYQTLSGTSLAAPHVTGALALLLNAFPDLTADEQEGALLDSAIDLGAAGPDNDFGYGRLDVLAAYEKLVAPGSVDATELTGSPTVNTAIRYGQAVTFSGVLTDTTTATPIAGGAVWVELTDSLGVRSWPALTDSGGHWSCVLATAFRRKATWKAYYLGESGGAPAETAPHVVYVAPKLTLATRLKLVRGHYLARHGTAFTVTGTSGPNMAGAFVSLQYRWASNSRWRTAVTAHVGTGGRFSARTVWRSAGRRYIRWRYFGSTRRPWLAAHSAARLVVVR